MEENQKANYPVSIIDMQATDVVYHDAASFPEGIQEAWQTIEEKLDYLTGRKMYAALWFPESGPIYRVCSTFTENEQLNLPLFTIPGGKYARIKIENWQQRINEFQVAAKQLQDEFGWKSTRPQLEFYRSQNEAYILHPID